MASKVTSPLFQLPNDPLGLVCQDLATKDLIHVFQTCKDGRALQTNPVSWQGRVERTLQSSCPDDLPGIQHEANLKLLAKINKEEGTEKTKEVQAFLATIYPDAAVESILAFTEEELVPEGVILQKHQTALEAEQLYKVFPKALIDGLGGYDSYLALPQLDLTGKTTRLGDPLNIFNLRPDHLADSEGHHHPIMRGVTGENLKFIAFAINTPAFSFVLTLFERDTLDDRMKLGKHTDMPKKYELSSNMVSEENIQSIVKIVSGTHEELSLKQFYD